MSKRQPSRCTVWLMPPTTSVDSRIVTASRLPGAHELLRRGEPGRPGADHHHGQRILRALCSPFTPACCRSAISLGNPVGRRPGGVLIGADLPGGGQCTQTLLGRSGHQKPREREHRARDQHRAERDQHHTLARPAARQVGRREHERHGREAVALE